jgi:hypothetical protein
MRRERALVGTAFVLSRLLVFRAGVRLDVGNVFWVAVLGCLVEVGENNRFRVLVHPDWIMLAALVCHRVTARIRGFAW